MSGVLQKALAEFKGPSRLGRWIVVLLPTLLVAALSIHLSASAEAARERYYLQTLVSTQARQIDLQLETYMAALLTIANSEALVVREDIGVLRREAERVGALFGGWFVLATAGDTLEILMNTGGAGVIPAPEAREAYGEVTAAEREALRTGRPAVSDAFRGRAVGETVVTLAIAVPGDHSPGRFLYMSFDTEHLSHLLSSTDLPEEHFLTIVDGTRRVIGRSEEIERFELAPLPGWFVAATEERDTGVFEGSPIEGVSGETRLFALQRLSAAPNWTLVASAPKSNSLFSGAGAIWPAVSTLSVFAALFAGTATRDRYRRIAEEKRQAEADALEKSLLIDALQDADARKARLLGIVSHELRTPLIAQLGVLDLLAPKLSSDDDIRFIEAARRDGHSMLALLDDLLEVARLGSGEVRLNETEFEAQSILADVAGIIRLPAERNGNTVALKVVGDPVRVRGDPSALRRILINFGTNAAKFTQQGTITLALMTRALSDTEAELTFSVADTGIGIAAESLPKLFTEFGVLEETRKLAPGGTGLGLAICKGLADAMGGTIWADSKPGSGSTFSVRIRFPLSPGSRVPATPQARVDLTGVRLLFAEDQEVIRLIVAQQLSAAGADVRTAVNGLEAVAHAETANFDLILMDLRMPVLDGAAAAQRIRDGGGANALTPIIALTAHQTPQTAAILSRGAIDACLSKPLDLAALADLYHAIASAGGRTGSGMTWTAGLADRATIDGASEDRPTLPEALIGPFLRELDGALHRIAAAIATRDLPAVEALAHRLSGIAKLSGATSLGDGLDALENAAGDGDGARVEEAAGFVRDLAERTRTELASLQVTRTA